MFTEFGKLQLSTSFHSSFDSCLHISDKNSKTDFTRESNVSSSVNEPIKMFEDLRLFQDHMIGLRPNLKASHNLFVLKTLIDEQFP